MSKYQESINATGPVPRKRIFYKLSDFASLSVEKTIISGFKTNTGKQIPLIQCKTVEVANTVVERLALGETLTRNDIETMEELQAGNN